MDTRTEIRQFRGKDIVVEFADFTAHSDSIFFMPW